MNKYIIILALSLSGCSVEPGKLSVQTVTVDKPVLMSCIPASYSYSHNFIDNSANLLKASNVSERYKLLIAGRMQRNNVISLQDKLISNCNVLK